MDQDKSKVAEISTEPRETALGRVFVDGLTPSLPRPPNDGRWSRVENGAYVPNVVAVTSDD